MDILWLWLFLADTCSHIWNIFFWEGIIWYTAAVTSERTRVKENGRAASTPRKAGIPGSFRLQLHKSSVEELETPPADTRPSPHLITVEYTTHRYEVHREKHVINVYGMYLTYYMTHDHNHLRNAGGFRGNKKISETHKQALLLLSTWTVRSTIKTNPVNSEILWNFHFTSDSGWTELLISWYDESQKWTGKKRVFFLSQNNANIFVAITTFTTFERSNRFARGSDFFFGRFFLQKKPAKNKQEIKVAFLDLVCLFF